LKQRQNYLKVTLQSHPKMNTTTNEIETSIPTTTSKSDTQTEELQSSVLETTKNMVPDKIEINHETSRNANKITHQEPVKFTRWIRPDLQQ